MPSVFVSYSHDPANPEHSHNVLRLAASLMRDGLTVFIDQNRSDDEEKIPWPIWMEDKIESADYVLLVCTELYSTRCGRRCRTMWARESAGRLTLSTMRST